MKRELYDIKL